MTRATPQQPNHSTRSILAAAIVSAAVLGAGTAAADRPSSPSEKRGYQNCLQAAEADNRGFYTAGAHYINRTETSRQFYINGGAWVGDRRQPVRVACETSRSGNRVIELTSAPGRFAPGTTVNTFEVAAK